MGIKNSIPEVWNITFLSEVTNYIRRGITPKYCENESIFIINQRCIRDNKVSLSNARFHDLSLKDVGDEKRLKFGDILICSTGVGTLGRVAQYELNNTLATVDSHVTIVRPNDNICKRFLGLLLSGKEREIEFLAEGTTGQTELPRTSLELLQINLPPLSEQKAISKVLTAFDDKIELLQAQNKTLETMAQTIFKEWFGKYQIGDELPEGWNQHNFIDLVKHIKPGTNYQPKRVESGIPFINGRHVKNGVIHFRDIKYITEEEYARVHKSWKPEKNDILITRIGTLGNVGIIQKTDLPLALHYNSINIKEDKLTHQFLYFLLKSEYFQEQFHLNKKQSVQEFITIEAVEQIKISIPPPEILEEKTKFFDNILLKILNNNSQKKSLIKTRNTLLPKLMSGQVRVNNLKQTANA